MGHAYKAFDRSLHVHPNHVFRFPLECQAVKKTIQSLHIYHISRKVLNIPQLTL